MECCPNEMLAILGNISNDFRLVPIRLRRVTKTAQKGVSHFDLKSDKFSIPWESKQLDSANHNKVLFHELFELVHMDVARHFVRNDHSQVAVFCGA